MSHPLVLALFDDRAEIVRGADAARSLEIPRQDLSIVARDHDEEAELARELGGTPGAEMEDSRRAGVFGEMGAGVIAAMAVVLPGIGPIVAAGPLAAELGELAGHAGGGLANILTRAGIDEGRARRWEGHVSRGGMLLGVHVRSGTADAVVTALRQSGASDVQVATWGD